MTNEILKTCSNPKDKGEQNPQECQNKMDVHAWSIEKDHGRIPPFAYGDANWLFYSPCGKGIFVSLNYHSTSM
jgi:hypothetical protein